MLQSQSNWKFTYNEDDVNTRGFNHGLAISDLTERLLYQRGIYSEDQAKAFLSPQLANLHKGSQINDMTKAVERVMQAVANQEPILVFGDYDADGVSSTTVMMLALQELGAVCEYYIPNRFTEGYGPNEESFMEAHRQGFQLIITVDTGIAAIHEADIAKQLGIDLVITDHHEAQEKLPDAFAIIHPKCSPNYPFKELAGVGVAFKFAEQLLGYFPKQLLDLVVIGTIADLVPLVDENRVLAYHGLQAISTSNRPGIKALKQICKIEEKMSADDIGFLIGPRINAVGRLQDANIAVDLLLSTDPQEAMEMAQYIDKLNQERQQIVAEIAKEATEMVELVDDEAKDSVIVVAKEGWNQGVLGIVASKLVRTFDRPAIVLAIDPTKSEAKGSARSIDAFDLFANCMQIRDTFIHFGGHAQAAGMTLDAANVSLLRDRLNHIASEQLSAEDYKQMISVDATIELENLTISVIKEIEKLAPFGMGNPKPIFHLKETPVEIRQIGSKQNHLKLSFQQQDKQLDAIGFGLGELYASLSKQSSLDCVGELAINEWNGKQKMQIVIKDIAVTDWQLFDYRGSKHWQKQLSLDNNQQLAAICFQGATKNSASLPIPVIQWVNKQSLETITNSCKQIILLDLPTRLGQLSELLATVRPERIYACYLLENSNYFQMMPSRDDFKWFYGMLLKRKRFNIKQESGKLSTHKGWKMEKLNFIIQVFFELEFVKIENDVVIPNSNPAKKDLTESSLYQENALQLEIEKLLYYSSYQELKQWLTDEMNQVITVKEEVSYGL